MPKRGNGEGSIYRTKDGRWRGSVTLPDGGRKYESGRTRQDVAAKLAPLMAKASSGAHVPAGRITVASWLSTWLKEDASSRLRPSTFNDYHSIVENHLSPALGTTRLTALRPNDVTRLHRQLGEKGLSGGRILKVHRVLGRALHVAERWGYVDKNVASLVSPPSYREEPAGYLDSREVKAVINALDGDDEAARWHLALLGLRQGEVLGLSWADVDLNNGILRVSQALQRQTARHGCGNTCGRKRGTDCPDRVGGGLVVVEPKSRASRRQLVLPPTVSVALRSRRTAQACDQLRAGDSWGNDLNLVFTNQLGMPLDAKPDNRAWKDLLRRAGVREIRLHDARHTAGAVLAQSGIHPRAQMEWMGHSQISQTMRYTHVLNEVAQETSDRLGQTLFGA